MSRGDYQEAIEKTVRSMWVDYELDDLDDAQDAIAELASAAVCYTSEAMGIMSHTSNPDAFTLVGLGECDCWSDIVTAVAYFAYRADLYDEARTWDEEDIFEARKVFRCVDCEEVTANEERHDDPEDADAARCLVCHSEWVEDRVIREEQGG